jgi:sugar phosphate isomerase/epimerase
MPKLPISVQLYTVRSLMQKDYAGTIKEVAKIGYKAVELAGFGPHSADEVKKICADAGVAISGAHVGIDALEKDVNKALDEQAALGNKNVIIPYLGNEYRTVEGYKKAAASMNKIAAECQKRGMELAYHNHSFEFDKLDGGQIGFDILYNNSDPKLVKAELDVYWLQHGGQDPVAIINRFGSRTLILHLKDMAAGADRKFAPVGEGILDFKGILEAATKHGVKYGAVEQDDTYGVNPLDAIKTSFANLQKLNG